MQRPQLSRSHISSPLTVVDSDDEEGPVVEGWSIFENSTDSSSSETTLGLDAPQSPMRAQSALGSALKPDRHQRSPPVHAV